MSFDKYGKHTLWFALLLSTSNWLNFCLFHSDLFDEKFQLILKDDDSDDSETESKKRKLSKSLKRKKLKAAWLDDDDDNIK